MKSLVKFIKESLDIQINESASVEAVLMFLNRWDGECVKICDLPDGTDGNTFAQELAYEFDSEDTVIEYCDDCKCIVIKPKDCEDYDDCKKIKYAELFKESLSEEEFKKLYVKVIQDFDRSQVFKHLEEIANDDLKLKKLYDKVKNVEQTKYLDTHDALYHLIQHGEL